MLLLAAQPHGGLFSHFTQSVWNPEQKFCSFLGASPNRHTYKQANKLAIYIISHAQAKKDEKENRLFLPELVGERQVSRRISEMNWDVKGWSGKQWGGRYVGCPEAPDGSELLFTTVTVASKSICLFCGIFSGYLPYRVVGKIDRDFWFGCLGKKRQIKVLNLTMLAHWLRD